MKQDDSSKIVAKKKQDGSLQTTGMPRVKAELIKAAPIVKDKFKQAGELMQTGVNRIIPSKADDPETRYFKLLGITFVGLILIGGIAGISSFLLTLTNPESVAVPNVVKKDLLDAFDELQAWGLQGKIEQQYNPDPASRGMVLEQEPVEGVSVKVGREIKLIVSRGPMMGAIGNYVGRNIDEVREEIRKQFVGESPMLRFGNITYGFDPSPQGTVLSQDPFAGREINNRLTINFFVSRGQDENARPVPGVVGLDYVRAIETLAQKEIAFEVRIVPSGGEDGPGVVTLQDPVEGQNLDPLAKVKLTVVQPEPRTAAQVSRLYSFNLPEYESAIDITVKTIDQTGGETILYRFKHPGGSLTFPYVLDVGTEIVVQAFNRVIDRYTVRKD